MKSLLGRGLRPGALVHLAPAALSVVLVFSLGSAKDPAMPLPGGAYQDKVGHLLAFAFVQFSHYRAARFLMEERTREFAAFASFLSASLVGAGLEIWQLLLPHRTAEWADLLADALGAGLMAWVVVLVGRRLSS